MVLSRESAERIRQNLKLGIIYANGYLEIDYNFYKYYVAINNEKKAQKSLESALQEAKLSRIFPLC